MHYLQQIESERRIINFNFNTLHFNGEFLRITNCFHDEQTSEMQRTYKFSRTTNTHTQTQTHIQLHNKMYLVYIFWTIL